MLRVHCARRFLGDALGHALGRAQLITCTLSRAGIIRTREANALRTGCQWEAVVQGMSVLPALQVLEEAMRTFDKNGDGLIQYQEFVSTLFPNLAKGFQQ